MKRGDVSSNSHGLLYYEKSMIERVDPPVFSINEAVNQLYSPTVDGKAKNWIEISTDDLLTRFLPKDIIEASDIENEINNTMLQNNRDNPYYQHQNIKTFVTNNLIKTLPNNNIVNKNCFNTNNSNNVPNLVKVSVFGSNLTYFKNFF